MLPNLPKCRVWAFELAVPGLRAVTHHPRTTSLRVLDHCCAQPGRRLFRQQTERAHRARVPILIKDEVRLRRPRVQGRGGQQTAQPFPACRSDTTTPGLEADHLPAQRLPRALEGAECLQHELQHRERRHRHPPPPKERPRPVTTGPESEPTRHPAGSPDIAGDTTALDERSGIGDRHKPAQPPELLPRLLGEPIGRCEQRIKPANGIEGANTKRLQRSAHLRVSFERRVHQRNAIRLLGPITEEERCGVRRHQMPGSGDDKTPPSQ